jgi:hypothetical protein
MPETVSYTLIAFILAFIAVEGLTARKKLAAINQYSAGGLANHLVGRRGSVVWLMWMLRTLGRNLADIVVTRRDAHFVAGDMAAAVRGKLALQAFCAKYAHRRKAPR